MDFNGFTEIFLKTSIQEKRHLSKNSIFCTFQSVTIKHISFYSTECYLEFYSVTQRDIHLFFFYIYSLRLHRICLDLKTELEVYEREW